MRQAVPPVSGINDLMGEMLKKASRAFIEQKTKLQTMEQGGKLCGKELMMNEKTKKEEKKKEINNNGKV